jgi:hypothetical protein
MYFGVGWWLVMWSGGDERGELASRSYAGGIVASSLMGEHEVRRAGGGVDSSLIVGDGVDVR